MKTIMHADNWVEIPAGECLLGISNEQARLLFRRLADLSGYASRPLAEQQEMDDCIEQLIKGKWACDDDAKLFITTPFSFTHIPQRRVWIDRFYIARYPITGKQLSAYLGQKVAAQALPDPLEPSQALNRKVYRPDVAMISDVRLALRLCEQLGGRLPTADEWEKAARGTEGQLYPWGEEWDETRGAFYRGGGRKYPEWVIDFETSIELYPDNLSPYGVWGQVGGIPELVTTDEQYSWTKLEVNGRHFSIGLKGSHPRESRQLLAFINHLPVWNGVGDWHSMRPVLDTWTQTQWRGVDMTELKQQSSEERA